MNNGAGAPSGRKGTVEWHSSWSFRPGSPDEFDLIGEGTHERVVVNLERFDQRVREKAARKPA